MRTATHAIPYAAGHAADRIGTPRGARHAACSACRSPILERTGRAERRTATAGDRDLVTEDHATVIAARNRELGGSSSRVDAGS
jgi:hypothetical protein